jgi:hypothetical protein
MSERNTAVRSLHDLGLAAWFGGSLMGAVGLNGAAEDEGGTEASRDRIASSGSTPPRSARTCSVAAACLP